jgi:hypothetical protein
MHEYAVVVEGLSAIGALDGLHQNIARTAKLAINSAVRKARAESSRRIRREVKFPASYLSESSGRLSISKFASDGDLEARISARRRPTSLARFVTSSLRAGGAQRDPGVQVQITPGSAVRLKRAFVIRLRVGTGDDDRSNLGVAIRLPAGKTPSRTSKAKRLSNGLWLLYGPSVDQVFIGRAGTGVAKDITPQVEADLENEFLRLLDLNL